MIWMIGGTGELKELQIGAESFDEALKIARVIDPGYCIGKVVEPKRPGSRILKEEARSWQE